MRDALRVGARFLGGEWKIEVGMCGNMGGF